MYVLWYFRVYGFCNGGMVLGTEGVFGNGRMVVVSKGCGMVFCLYGFSIGRMYRLKAVMLQCKYMYVW